MSLGVVFVEVASPRLLFITVRVLEAFFVAGAFRLFHVCLMADSGWLDKISVSRDGFWEPRRDRSSADVKDGLVKLVDPSPKCTGGGKVFRKSSSAL